MADKLEVVSDPGEENCVISGKRKRNEINYRRNVIKKNKLKGVEHVNWIGKTVAARTTGEQCGCKKKCFENLSNEDFNHAITTMNSFDTKDEQDLHLQRLIELQKIKSRRPRSENGILRKGSYKYYFIKSDSSKTEVCKKAFVSLYGIGKKQVERLCNLLYEGKSPKDRRGSNEKANTIPGEILHLIQEHIESFPTKETHYCGKGEKYLDARLNVKLMYDLFITKHPDSGVKYKFYLQCFHENFSLRFGRPQVDVCSKCEELGVKIKSSNLCDSLKRVAVVEMMVHKRRSKKFYNKIKEVEEICKERNYVLGICFDYMQNLPLPNIPVQEMFYYRQLWVINFNIHNLKDHTAHFYSYHEGTGHKSPNEVCSLFLNYIENYVPSSVKEFYLFSDNCGGQNKNHTVIRLLLALTQMGRFNKIIHYFPRRGHSFLPCDRDFGVVKRKLRKTDRVYVPEQYNTLIHQENTNNRFSVESVTTDDILNFKCWWPEHYKKTTCSLDTLGKKGKNKKMFSPTQFSEFVYSKDDPGCVTASVVIGSEISKHRFCMTKTGTGRMVMPTQKAYNGKIPINTKKLGDVSKVRQYIPLEHSFFYEEILNWPSCDKESTEDVASNIQQYTL
ncbi:uncharacterized protein [Periplaneta americana]|uniref:uncharacterized protein n=1 Tax=Periplaneta americana TaxID=6978 RepID=UPI0037E7519D